MGKNALSISSNVSHGYVGNRAVVFPLQFYGWNVDAIHTTNFSNHPGYGQFKGSKTEPEEIQELFKGLKNILNLQKEYDLLVVGYCHSAQVMSTIYDNISPLLMHENRPVLVVDPVLGDNGKLYVPEDIVEVHTKFLSLGLVDLTTPNQFELELLTGVSIDSWSSVKQALETFNRKYHVPNVVISSVIIGGLMYGVGFSKNSDNHIFSIPIPTIDCRFSGCGDVFTALITHAFCENKCELTPEILGQVLAKLGRILNISYKEEEAKTGKKPTVVQDVRLIQSRDVFEQIVESNYKVRYL